MSHKLTAKVLAAALACAAIPAALVTDSKPATAQVALTVSFNYFHRQLTPYGRWFYHPHWGDVWMPTVADFRPYYRHGHWAYSDAGWLWVSDYRWGDIAFHYGRWVYDPQYGWLWVPGYVWAPAWVIWREGDGDIGWCPMPPDDAWLAGQEVWPVAWNDADRAYGYMDWYGPNYGPNWLAASAWVFVPQAHFADRNFTSFAADPQQARRLIGTTRDVTNYANVNGYVANRSIDPAAIGRASGRSFAATPAHNVLGARAPIDPISTGQRVHTAEVSRHGGDPHAAANAQAVPLNAAAAARGGRATFGNRAAANAVPNGVVRGAGAPNGAPGANRTAREAAANAPSTERGPAANRTAREAGRGAAPNAPSTERSPARFAGSPRQPGVAARGPRGQEQMHFAGRAEMAPRGPAAHYAGPAERGPAMASGGPHGGGPRGGGGPHFAAGGPPPGFGGGGRPRGGGGGPPPSAGGGGEPHGGGGGPPGGAGGGGHGHGHG
ncbi:MAG: hypothetical protein KGO48_03735 [Alphaproteobacteria bacterium]|nr:hypothetical protein [Alphaproteobacteria bacterium]